MNRVAPLSEDARLAELRAYGVLDTAPERDFDDIAALAAELCEAPLAMVSFVDADRQWFKARVGLEATETPIAQSLCAQAIRQSGLYEIGDIAADARTADHPIRASNPQLRFYAGAPIVTDRGLALGSLCVLDTRPRTLTETQRRALTVLARQVLRQLDLRRALRLAETRRHEADHRVKNSLQSVASYARLLGRQAGSPDARAALAQVEGQIETVAALHGLLHASDEAAHVDLGRYLAEVGALLQRTCPPEVRLTVTSDPQPVTAEVATACAVIVNEALSNALKHAFPDGRRGQVTATGRMRGESFVLDCRDDGVGLPPAPGGGLGLTLIDSTAAQLGAEVTRYDARPGAGLTVTIPRSAWAASPP